MLQVHEHVNADIHLHVLYSTWEHEHEREQSNFRELLIVTFF
jgi:hypothetical protein